MRKHNLSKKYTVGGSKIVGATHEVNGRYICSFMFSAKKP